MGSTVSWRKKTRAEMTPEELEKARAKGRRDAARLRERRKAELAEKRRAKYWSDAAHREKLKEKARAAWHNQTDAEKLARYRGSIRAFQKQSRAQLKRIAGWRWLPDHWIKPGVVAMVGDVGEWESLMLGEAWDWHDRWLESLDEGHEPVW